MVPGGAQEGRDEEGPIPGLRDRDSSVLCENAPSACSFEIRGDTGIFLLGFAFGIPLADAKLLAIELDRSLPVLLPVRDSRGGCTPASIDLTVLCASSAPCIGE